MTTHRSKADSRFRQAVVAVVGVVTCLALLTACGGSSGGSDTTESTDAGTGDSQQLGGSITWYETAGGITSPARQKILFPAFTEETGVDVRGEYNPDSTKFFAAMENGGASPWDVIEFPAVGDFLSAKEEGYLAPLDTSVVPVDELAKSAYDKYGILGERYGITIVWNTEVWPESGKHPTSLADIYNTKDFPGKRCMFEYPAFGATLESALLADGVPRDELYPLDTKRAYEKLDTIKSDIVWYERDLPKLMLSGECDIGIGWSGTIRAAVEEDDAPLAISWDDALYTEAAFAIPKNAKNMAGAQAMLAFLITDKKAQREFVEATAYPTDIKGIEYPQDLVPWLPLGDNLKTATSEDAQYYKKHLGELAAEFTKWAGS